MLKKVFIAIFLVLGIIGIIHITTPQHDRTIGIVVPLEHRAMDAITTSFQQELGSEINYKVLNAHGDTTLQQSIIKQLTDQNVDIIVPIGTNTTQMALTMANGIPVLGLAVLSDDDIQRHYQNNNTTGIHDEVSAAKQLSFFKEVIPSLSKITLVFSPNEKIFDNVKELTTLLRKDHINCQQLMINQLSDIYNIANTIYNDSQMIFVFKDHLVVSGIPALSQAANKIGIPLITSDEGSVADGATCALGVAESDIGRRGATIAKRILSGEKAHDIPIDHIDELSIFINHSQQTIDAKTISNAANKLGYTTIEVGEKNEYPR